MGPDMQLTTCQSDPDKVSYLYMTLSEQLLAMLIVYKPAGLAVELERS